MTLDNTQIDEANAFGNTALHVACFNGQDAVVSELIDYGANVSQPNNKGFTPLHFAAASTHGALCLEFLVNNGADVNVQVGELPALCAKRDMDANGFCDAFACAMWDMVASCFS